MRFGPLGSPPDRRWVARREGGAAIELASAAGPVNIQIPCGRCGDAGCCLAAGYHPARLGGTCEVSKRADGDDDENEIESGDRDNETSFRRRLEAAGKSPPAPSPRLLSRQPARSSPALGASLFTPRAPRRRWNNRLFTKAMKGEMA